MVEEIKKWTVDSGQWTSIIHNPLTTDHCPLSTALNPLTTFHFILYGNHT
jgi:hypothetical protein